MTMQTAYISYACKSYKNQIAWSLKNLKDSLQYDL